MRIVLVFVAQKLLRLLLLLMAVAVFTFVLLSLLPIDPVRAYIGADMMRISAEQQALIAQRWRLDQPMWARFLDWLVQLVQGNWGTSMASPPGVLAQDVTFWQHLHHLLLPAIALSIIGIANITLHTRQKLIEVLHSDYVLFGRAQGETLWNIIRYHGLRNILLPAITLQFASLSELFGGSVLVEQVFAYPGLGEATVQAALRSDIPLLVGIVFFSALFVYTGNTLADLAYSVIDPRLRSHIQAGGQSL